MCIRDRHIAGNKRQNLIKKACLAIVNGINPYIDRILNEVHKLTERDVYKRQAYKDLSPSIINALIATEDVRFVEHSGIYAKALFRAFVKRGLMHSPFIAGILFLLSSMCIRDRRIHWINYMFL